MKKIAVLLAALLLLGAATGCGSSKGEASVQSVSMICGLGSTGLVDRFAGMVSPQGETTIKYDDTATIDEIKVAVGDEVKKDQVLFLYDVGQAQMDLDKANLELDRLKYELENRKAEKQQLETDKAGASEDLQLSYSLEIREADAAIQEATYNISLKEKEVEKLAKSLSDTSVKSPVDGRVQAINENGGSDAMGNPLPLMTIVETAGYRVKGYVNESSAGALSEGTPVIVRSRVNDDFWRGTITSVDWTNPQQSQNNYGDSDTVMPSKYPFYVTLEGSEGLLLGQHVYIEPDYGQAAEQQADAIMLPSWYITDADTNPWVWAQNGRGKLEKRSVELGTYDEMNDAYEVVSGLSAEDYIAYPEETLQAGMTCVTYDEGAFSDGSMGDGTIVDGGMEDGVIAENGVIADGGMDMGMGDAAAGGDKMEGVTANATTDSAAEGTE